MTVRFLATVRIRGVNPFVLVSPFRARAIRANWRRPLPVIVRLNGLLTPVWHVNMMPAGNGSFYLYLHGALRRSARITVGDRIEVQVDFDSDYKGGPQSPTPTWFTDGLAANPLAAASWEALTPSRKKELVRYFAHLKSAEARARNLARVLHVLSGGHARFMGRDWKDGS